MTSIRVGLSRIRLLCKVASKEHVRLVSPGAGLSLNVRSFSISSKKFTEENSYNFHVQDEEDFQKRVIQSKTPMVVDFHAEWCGPCKLLGPKLEKAVDEHEGKILLAKVDIDELSEIAMQFKVRVVPTVVGIKDGEASDQFEGNLQDDELKAFLNKLL